MAPEPLPTPSDPPVLTFEHPLGAVGYTDEGDGAPIVLVHGLPGSHRDWRYLAACLPDFRVIRLDMPGFGDSQGCDAAPSFEQRAEVIVDAVTSLGLSRPLVMGHSMGGPVVAMAANRAPERFAGIGLLASPGLRRHRRAPDTRASVVARLVAMPLGSWALRRPLARVYRAAGFPASLSHASRVAALRQVVMYRPHAVAQTMRELTLPTLIAYAADDDLVEAAIGDELANVCPDGPRLRFATGGHNLQKMKCREIAEAIRAWPIWT
ncbi:MAG: alpha/beta fold hydrolase [Myxococcota bacterium]